MFYRLSFNETSFYCRHEHILVIVLLLLSFLFLVNDNVKIL